MKTDKKYEENARRLKLAMSEAGLSQKDLSARTGIGKSSLSQYMNGLNWPDDNRKVGQIAEILNVNPAWLMGFNVQMPSFNSFLISIIFFFCLFYLFCS